MSLECACIHLVQVGTNLIQCSTFRCRCRWMLELMRLHWSYPNVEHSSELGSPSLFRGCLSLIFYLRCKNELEEDVPLVFLSYLFSDVVFVQLWQLHINALMNYFLHLNILLLDGCCELMLYNASLCVLQSKQKF